MVIKRMCYLKGVNTVSEHYYLLLFSANPLIEISYILLLSNIITCAMDEIKLIS